MEFDEAQDSRLVVNRFKVTCWNCGRWMPLGIRVWYSRCMKRSSHEECGRPVWEEFPAEFGRTGGSEVTQAKELARLTRATALRSHKKK